jgi:Tol biopolymer transport system component
VGALAIVTLAAVAIVSWRAARRPREWRPSVVTMPAFDENSDQVDFSPDGKLIAYPSDLGHLKTLGIRVAASDGSGDREITPPDWDAAWPMFTPDGRVLVVRFPERSTYEVPLDGGAPTIVAEHARAIACGDAFLMLTEDVPRQFVLRDGGGERVLHVFDPGEYAFYSRCDRRGERVVFAMSSRPGSDFHHPSDLYVLSITDGAMKRLTFDEMENQSPVFTPDGRSVVFSSLRGGQNKANLWEIAAAGGTPRELTFDEGPDLSVNVSPDGERAIYTIDTTTQRLYTTLPGGARRRLTSVLDEDLLALSVEPDGSAIIASNRTRGPETDQIVELRPDGAERILTSGDLPSATPDGSEIVFARGAEVLAIPRAGGPIRQLATMGGLVTALLVDTARRVHVTVLLADGPEAWAVPLGGGAPAREAPSPTLLVVPAPIGGWTAAFVGSETDIYSARIVPPGAALDDPRAIVVEDLRSAAWAPDGAALFASVEDTGIERVELPSGARSRVADVTDSPALAVSPDARSVYFTDVEAHTTRHMITNFASRPRP